MNMKKSVFFVLAMMLLASCGNKQQTASEDVVTREQLTFPIGDKIENPAFTGDA